MDCPEEGRTAGWCLQTRHSLHFPLAVWRPLDEDERVEWLMTHVLCMSSNVRWFICTAIRIRGSVREGDSK